MTKQQTSKPSIYVILKRGENRIKTESNNDNDDAMIIANSMYIFVTVPTIDVQGVLGKKASLPCDIQPLHSEDAVSMVLWFKESDGEPLYR